MFGHHQQPVPEVRTLSFRDQTMGGVNDLLVDEGLTCAQSQNIITYLAGELLAYREEGISMAPVIFYCRSIGDALRSFPGSSHYKVGTKPLDVGSGRGILKDCASLANKNWFIYIERDSDQTVSYGVATFETLPGSVTLLEGVGLSDHTLVVVLKKTSEKTIKVWGSKGSQLTCLFSTSRDEATDIEAVHKFADQVCCGIEGEDERAQFRDYLVPTLEGLLQGSHGCILACTVTDPINSIPQLADSIPLDPPIDAFSAYMAFKADPSASNLASLQAYYGLVEGLVRSDGIAVFDTKGRLVAFRTFYRPVGDQGDEAEEVVGGARRRAFEGARSLVGNGLAALLFRSQDGLTLFDGTEA